MPCLTTICICGQRLVIYAPPSKLFETLPMGTSRDLEERDRLEDPDRLTQAARQEVSESALFLDTRKSSACPTCSKQFRFSDSPGLLLKNGVSELPVSYMFWNTALILAEGEGWIPQGVRGPLGVIESHPTIASYLDGHEQIIQEGEASRIAHCLERVLPEIPTEEMQTGELDEDPRHTLSGRFRPSVIHLISFLKTGDVVVHRDREALTLYSEDDMEGFGFHFRMSLISRN